MSTVFMELPSKKEWAIYYKQIKKPQCLENIFVRWTSWLSYNLWLEFSLETYQTKGIRLCRGFRSRCGAGLLQCNDF
jgi:hypothetical protein